jgi:hypothetical protein
MLISISPTFSPHTAILESAHQHGSQGRRRGHCPRVCWNGEHVHYILPPRSSLHHALSARGGIERARPHKMTLRKYVPRRCNSLNTLDDPTYARHTTRWPIVTAQTRPAGIPRSASLLRTCPTVDSGTARKTTAMCRTKLTMITRIDSSSSCWTMASRRSSTKRKPVSHAPPSPCPQSLTTPNNRRTQHRHLHLQQGRPHARQSPLPAPSQVRLHRLLRIQSPPPALRDFRAPRLHRRHNHTQGCYNSVLQGRCWGPREVEAELPDRVVGQEDCQRGRGGTHGARAEQLLDSKRAIADNMGEGSWTCITWRSKGWA